MSENKVTVNGKKKKIVRLYDFHTWRVPGSEKSSISLEINVTQAGYHFKYKPFLGIPADVRKQALIASAYVQDPLVDLGTERRMRRDQMDGELDPRKIGIVAEGLYRGDFDEDEVRPYMHKVAQPAMPRIAIVASAGLYECSAKPNYLRTITSLALGVAQACEVAGAKVSVTLHEGMRKSAINPLALHGAAQYVYRLVNYGDVPDMKMLEIALSTQLWSECFNKSLTADHVAGMLNSHLHREAFTWTDPEVMAKLKFSHGYDAKKLPYQSWYGTRIKPIKAHNHGAFFPSNNGGGAVLWARAVEEADLVIAIGAVEDGQYADAFLPDTSLTIQQAAQMLGQQIRRLMK